MFDKERYTSTAAVIRLSLTSHLKQSILHLKMTLLLNKKEGLYLPLNICEDRGISGPNQLQLDPLPILTATLPWIQPTCHTINTSDENPTVQRLLMSLLAQKEKLLRLERFPETSVLTWTIPVWQQALMIDQVQLGQVGDPSPSCQRCCCLSVRTPSWS